MKVTLEKLPASQVRLALELPAERVKSAYDQAVQKLARETNIPGFRKGKVPKQVLIQRFGSRRLNAMVLEDLMTTSFQQAASQENIDTVGEFTLQPSFEEVLDRFNASESITFSAVVDVRPEVILRQYRGLVVKAEDAKPDFSQVDRLLEDKQREIATLIPVEDRPAIEGDLVVLDFQGQLVLPDGQEPSAEDKVAQEIVGKEVRDAQVDLLADRFIPGFAIGVVGMRPGETKDLSVQFPGDYSQPELAGKSVVFSVTLKELKAKELPELNDDFAQEVSEFETFAELRESLENRQRREAEKQLEQNKRSALGKELLKQIEVDLPATLIDQEINTLLNETAGELQSRGININEVFSKENLPFLRQQTKPQAVERLKLTLALYKIAELESITVDPKAVNQNVQSILSQYKGKESIDREALKTLVHQDLLQQEVMRWLEQYGVIELVPEGSLQGEAQPELPEKTELPAPESVENEVEAEQPDVEEANEEASEDEPESQGTLEASSERKTKQLKGRRSVKAKQEAAEAEAESEAEA